MTPPPHETGDPPLSRCSPMRKKVVLFKGAFVDDFAVNLHAEAPQLLFGGSWKIETRATPACINGDTRKLGLGLVRHVRRHLIAPSTNRRPYPGLQISSSSGTKGFDGIRQDSVKEPLTPSMGHRIDQGIRRRHNHRKTVGRHDGQGAPVRRQRRVGHRCQGALFLRRRAQGNERGFVGKCDVRPMHLLQKQQATRIEADSTFDASSVLLRVRRSKHVQTEVSGSRCGKSDRHPRREVRSMPQMNTRIACRSSTLVHCTVHRLEIGPFYEPDGKTTYGA